jgi:transcriptional regulator with PAS, ATPase and Fis domain
MVLIQHALEQSRTRIELGAHKRSQSEKYSFAAIERSGGSFSSLVALAEKLAQNPMVTLLIEGETGVGKEFLARTIHHGGPREAGPFVPISCAAIPDTLLESELFGHEPGAFTDARTRKRGLFELAEGGTLFLDEIGEMSPGMQAKLLRAIETRSFRRVGGTDDLTVDSRVIAATNVVMERALAERKFREDLYYRLKVGHLTIPPLRERQNDILPLANRLMKEVSREMGRQPLALDKEVQKAFQDYRWPGNVRELKNVIERAVILQEKDVPISISHLPYELQGDGGRGPTPANVHTSLAAVEREHILRILKSCDANHTKAAKMLGISRTTLWEKLKQYRLTE